MDWVKYLRHTLMSSKKYILEGLLTDVKAVEANFAVVIKTLKKRKSMFLVFFP